MRAQPHLNFFWDLQNKICTFVAGIFRLRTQLATHPSEAAKLDSSPPGRGAGIGVLILLKDGAQSFESPGIPVGFMFCILFSKHSTECETAAAQTLLPIEHTDGELMGSRLSEGKAILG